ncbi:MAG: esterase [Anaerolineae bacterium]|nr:esterase [Anaerolineae bacterium]
MSNQNSSRVEALSLDSRVLRDNPLGDPHVRQVSVYIPPGHDTEPDRRYPTLYLLSSHGSTGPSLMNWRAWDVSIKEQIDALIEGGHIPPVIVVMPDMWTRFGSSQFINSNGMGRYEDMLTGEIVPLIDASYRTLADRDHRGVMGRSSGGYGAIVQAMRHPDTFGAVACHSGDLYWEYTCLPGLSRMHQHLERFGGLDDFIRDIPTIRPKNSAFWDLIMTVCWSAAFGSSDSAPHGFDLPVDPVTGALNPDVWQRWLAHDPVRMIDDPAHADALRRARLVFIDAGQFDEYQLQVGARILHHKLDALAIDHVYEEFPDGHRGTHYRYADSLPRLVKALMA